MAAVKSNEPLRILVANQVDASVSYTHLDVYKRQARAMQPFLQKFK